jgi:hypothetical protein
VERRREALVGRGLKRAKLEKRVKFWQERLSELGVSHWRLESICIVEECESGKSAAASIHFPADYDSFDLQFKREHLKFASKQRIDEDIVHEFLHLAWRDMDDTTAGVTTWMPNATYDDWRERYKHEQEGLIERTARLIVRLHDESGTV